MNNRSKQAVILIHGVGEQRPMDALRSFVDAVWVSDSAVHHEHAKPGVFSKPDEISGNYELRRLTTTQNRNNVRTDFYEFYLAYMISGTSLNHVTAWVKRLVWRAPWNVPKPLQGAWYLLVILLLVVAFFVVMTIMPESLRIVTLPRWLTGILGIAVAWFAVPMINNIIGDAARYLDPAPTNIHQRQEIRAKGVDLLKKLHDSQQYGRIVVVGHSLGSVIGYDMLTYAWPSYNDIHEDRAANPKLDELEAAVATGEVGIDEFQAKQRQLLSELQANGNPWLVTDFLTLGSPLTHASILMAHDEADLASKENDREYPTCPPVLEKGKFSYPHDRKTGRTLHHAALFGPTRWTNLYFPSRWLIYGDIISGPLRKLFGKGIRDRKVSTKRRGGS